MAKYCGRCGSKLDEITGLCPKCNNSFRSYDFSKAESGSSTEKALTRKEKRRKSKKKKLAAMTFGQKLKRFFLRFFIWLLIWLVLALVVVGGLVYLDIVDIPVVKDAMQDVDVALHREHKWQPATCMEPMICKICGETDGEAMGHIWTPATCTSPSLCSMCGELGDEATGHNWTDATCTDPKTCLICKTTEGSAAGHNWTEATYKSPKTCEICGEAEGKPLKPDPIYINELKYSDKYGKLWTRSEEVPDYFTHSNVDDPAAYLDMNTPGHVSGKVYDHLGNRYTYGLCVDLGGPASTYYVSFDLEGIYTNFAGVCSMSEDMKGTTSSKYFEIYCDGKLVFTSNTMTKGSTAQEFSIDITDVKVLRIQYPPTKGQNRIATLFDGRLS